MELYVSPTSPYARKARIVVREKGMLGWVSELVVRPFEDPSALLALSAVAKVPTLVDGAQVIEDSRVICLYLDSLGRPALEPKGTLRWDDRTRGAVGDAVSDAAVAVRMESLRPAAERSPAAMERHRQRVQRIVRDLRPGAHNPTLGDISVACGLAYLDLRWPRVEWRELNAELASWHAVVEARPAFSAVAFPR